MRSYENIAGYASLDNSPKKSGNSSTLPYPEMGKVAQITTRADHAGTFEMSQPHGIHVERSWEQTSLSKNWLSRK